MAYRLVYSEFWTDPKVMEEMTQEEKFFYLYILTNPSTTNCGIYGITKKQMAFESGCTIKAVNNLMDKFENHYKLISYNAETRELAIKNWGKYNLNRGGKPVIDCLTSELSKIKDKTLIEYIEANISNEALKELYKSFCDSSENYEREVAPLDERQGDNTDTYTDTNTSTNTDTHTERDTSSDTEANNLSLSIIQEYEKITGHIGVLNLSSVKIAVMQHGYDNVKKAIDKALEKGKLSMSYVNGILRTWAKEGYPKEGEKSDRDTGKDNGTGKNEFSGFKPKEPRVLTEEEQQQLEGELI